MDITLSAQDWPHERRGVTVPSSKSFVHRQLIAAALADAPTEIALRGFSQDIAASAACIRALGGGCERLPGADGTDRLRVIPCGATPRALPRTTSQALPHSEATPCGAVEKPLLDAGESGSTARFLLPVAAALAATQPDGGLAAGFGLTGHGRLPQRPMAPLCAALRAHGCTVSADCLPLTVTGRLTPGAYRLPGNVSSQYITGLLLALPLLAGDSVLTLTTPPVSAGYLDITLRVLADFGVRVQPLADGWRIPGPQRYHSPGALTAEGDWSGAAFWLVADALLRQRGAAGLTVWGLNEASVQGDRAVQAAITAITADGDTVLDAAPIPDLVPVLAVLAAGQRKRTTFTGAARLRLKESDRLATTCALLQALGGQAQPGDDTLTVTGGGALDGGRVDGAGDHRIVMAAAVAALLCQGPVTITGCEAVDKSYPGFFEELRGLQR